MIERALNVHHLNDYRQNQHLLRTSMAIIMGHLLRTLFLAELSGDLVVEQVSLRCYGRMTMGLQAKHLSSPLAIEVFQGLTYLPSPGLMLLSPENYCNVISISLHRPTDPYIGQP